MREEAARCLACGEEGRLDGEGRLGEDGLLDGNDLIPQSFGMDCCEFAISDGLRLSEPRFAPCTLPWVGDKGAVTIGERPATRSSELPWRLPEPLATALPAPEPPLRLRRMVPAEGVHEGLQEWLSDLKRD